MSSILAKLLLRLLSVAANNRSTPTLYAMWCADPDASHGSQDSCALPTSGVVRSLNTSTVVPATEGHTTMSIFIAEVAGPVLDCDLDEQLQKKNHFFKSTRFVLDDLNEYKCFATICSALIRCSEMINPGLKELAIRDVQAMIPKLVAEIDELHAAMDAENAA